MLVGTFIQKLQLYPFLRLKYTVELQDIFHPVGTDNVVHKIAMFPWVYMH